jgi:putative hydrolase
MYKIKVDSHVHSILTNHAYSTIEENAIHAKKKGIQAIAITDHFGLAEQKNIHNIVANIANRKVLPRKMHGVCIIKGVEIDIIDHNGTLPFGDITYPFDKDKSLLEVVTSSCEMVIASIHQTEYFSKKSILEYTNAYIKALQNPAVKVIGHIGRLGMRYNLIEILKVAHANNKAIEINSASLKNQDTRSVCKNIAEKCANENVAIAIGSDAHCAYSIGDFARVIKLLKEINFPKHLVLNVDLKKFIDFFGIKL